MTAVLAGHLAKCNCGAENGRPILYSKYLIWKHMHETADSHFITLVASTDPGRQHVGSWLSGDPGMDLRRAIRVG